MVAWFISRGHDWDDDQLSYHAGSTVFLLCLHLNFHMELGKRGWHPKIFFGTQKYLVTPLTIKVVRMVGQPHSKTEMFCKTQKGRLQARAQPCGDRPSRSLSPFKLYSTCNLSSSSDYSFLPSSPRADSFPCPI